MNIKKHAGGIAVVAILAALAGVPYLEQKGAYEVMPAVTDPLEAAIDINSAPAFELSDLPGIGTELAAAIVRYREENGPFERIEDVMNVPGIGEGKFGAIKDRIRAGAAPEGQRDGE